MNVRQSLNVSARMGFIYDGDCASLLNCCCGVLACGVGSLGAVHANWPASYPVIADSLPTVFGVVLAALVSCRFRVLAARAGTTGTRGLAAMSRQLSRLVFLSLYILVGETQLLAVFYDHSIERSTEGIRGCLLAGLIVLVYVRVLARVAGNSKVIAMRSPG